MCIRDRFTGILIGHAVAQSAKSAVFRVYEGDGADTGQTIPHKSADAIGAAGFILHRLHLEGLFLLTSLEMNGELGSLAAFHGLGHGFVAVYRGVIDFDNQVTQTQSGLFSRRALGRSVYRSKAHHHGPLGKELDTGGVAKRDEAGALRTNDLAGVGFGYIDAVDLSRDGG